MMNALNGVYAEGELVNSKAMKKKSPAQGGLQLKNGSLHDVNACM